MAPEFERTKEQDDAARRRALAWIDVFRDAWSTGDTDRLLEVIHPDASVLYPLMSEPVDREGLRSFFEMGRSAIPDFRIELLHWAASGDEVFCEWRASGTAAGHHHLDWRGCDRFTFRGELIVEARAYADPGPIAAALAAAEQPVEAAT